MKVGKIGVVVISLVPFNVYGECTPTPDCASIGYTETSCEGDSLKCPFDITKMMCMPCDSSFRYDCSGENITGGTGSACGGKYVSCECSSSDYIFSNGSCLCDSSCKVGAIYYSDGTCSACVDNTKTAIGVVVKDNELIVKEIISMTWSSSGIDVSELPNVNDATVVKTDFNGKDNTLAIVKTFPNDTIENNASVYCNSYSTKGSNAGDWYLPAAGELYSYIYGEGTNYNKIKATMANLGWNFGNNWTYSSSEVSSWGAWVMRASDGYMHSGFGKPHPYTATCFLEIN